MMNVPDNYILIQKDVMHARLRVSEDSRIRIIIPLTFSQEDVNSLLIKKQGWIDKKLKFFKGMTKINLQRNQLLLFGNRYNYFYDSAYEYKVIVDHEHKTIKAKRNLLDTRIQKKWMTETAKSFLLTRTEVLAENLSIEFNRLYIRSQKTKLGNCSKEKNISLNWRLIKSPMFVIDYLIIHELTHTIVMNHTIKFWTMLKSYYPEYKDAIRWLEKYGNNL